MAYRSGLLSYADAFVTNYVRLRQRQKISLQELSDRTGIAKSYLSEIQTGSSGISLEYAARIAAALNEPLVAMISVQERSEAPEARDA